MQNPLKKSSQKPKLKTETVLKLANDAVAQLGEDNERLLSEKKQLDAQIKGLKLSIPELTDERNELVANIEDRRAELKSMSLDTKAELKEAKKKHDHWTRETTQNLNARESRLELRETTYSKAVLALKKDQDDLLSTQQDFNDVADTFDLEKAEFTKKHADYTANKEAVDTKAEKLNDKGIYLEKWNESLGNREKRVASEEMELGKDRADCKQQTDKQIEREKKLTEQHNNLEINRKAIASSDANLKRREQKLRADQQEHQANIKNLKSIGVL